MSMRDQEYFAKIGNVVTVEEIEAMSEETFESTLATSDDRPLFIADDQDQLVVCVPVKVFNGMIGDLTGTYEGMA